MRTNRAAGAASAEQRHANAARSALETWEEPDLQAMVDLALELTGAPMATITVLDEGEFHFLVAAGTEPFCTALDDAMCAHSMGVPGIVEVPDALRDERMSGLPFVDGRAGSLRFYASAPIYATREVMVGRFCLFDVVPRTLEPEQRRLLSVLADSAGKLIQRELEWRRRADPSAADRDTLRRAAHDLSAPVTAATACLEMLEEIVEAPPDSAAATLIRTGRSALARGHGLLEAALAAGDQPTVTVEDLGLSDVLDAVCHDLAPAIARAGARLEWGPLPTVRADPVQLHRVLLNLTSNAIKFARAGVPPRISVTASTDGGICTVRVTDDGRGIAPQDRERAFEMFTRLTSEPGHGIGLSTVAQLVGAHGGEVGIGGNPAGVGTEVWFTLPVPEAASADPADPADPADRVEELARP